MSERGIEEYVCLNVDKSLREIRAGIIENFGVSKSLKWISKAKKEYQAADFEIEATDVERDPEIIDLKKDIRKEQLQKNLLMEKAGVKRIEELLESIDKLERNLGIARRSAREAWDEVRRLKNTPCPICAGKYISRVTGGYRCNLCGSYVKELHPRKEHI